MSTRLPSALLVSALVRQVNDAGGFAMVIRKGDADRGIILVQTAENGRFQAMFERMEDFSGHVTLVRCGPTSDNEVIELTNYLQRRIASDPDLWVVELDIPNGERFADAILTAG